MSEDKPSIIGVRQSKNWKFSLVGVCLCLSIWKFFSAGSDFNLNCFDFIAWNVGSLLVPELIVWAVFCKLVWPKQGLRADLIAALSIFSSMFAARSLAYIFLH